ncbi:transglycosylase SLT domain-containing protein [Streptomyces sp. NPDC059994]|uniref:transglycosylase SLT domain-containing protein n=1 Tax=Streptomyces sp. NPDC059994 TaxID=3347029 RepID=UPI0036BB370D
MSQIATAGTKAAQQAGKQTEKSALDTSNKLRQVERSLTRFHGEEAGKRFRTFRNLAKQREQLEEGTSKVTRKAIAEVVKSDKQAVAERARLAREQDRANRARAQEMLRSYRDDVRQYDKAQRDKVKAHNEAKAEERRANAAIKREEVANLREVRQVQRQTNAELRAENKRLRDEERAQERERREAKAQERREVAAIRRVEAAELREVRQIQRAAALERQKELAAERLAQQQLREVERLAAAERRRQAALDRANNAVRVEGWRSEIRALQEQRSAYADTIRQNRAQINRFNRDHTSILANAGGQWKALSQGTETFGQNLEQVGRSITQNLVMPLMAAAGYVTKIGATSADMQFYSSEGLNRAGFNQKEVSKGIQSIQDFAVNTPFSLEDMTDKFSQVARNFESYGNSTSNSLKKSELLIKGIADYAASFGVTSPEKVKGGMMAADMMMDQGKLSTRYLRQFVRGTGIPMNELGKIAGYKGGPDFLKEVQDPKGGVNSKEFFDKFIKAYQTAPGVKGSAETLGTGSIGGHFTSVKEQMQLNLGKLFGGFNEETGKFEWTALGKNVHDLANRLGDLVEDPDFQKLTGSLSGNLIKAVNLLISGFETVQGYLNDHPALRDLVVKAVKVAAVLGPLAIAVGLATKVLGKVGKAFSPLLKLSGGLAKGVRGAYRTGNQVLGGLGAGRGNFREEYRARRANYHDGDDRSAARRGVDSLRGQDSRSTRLNVQTGEAEAAVKELDRQIQALQNRIHNLNREQLNQVANELGGEGGASVRGRASAADHEIDQARLSVRELNQGSTGELVAALRAVGEAANSAEAKLKEVRTSLRDLNDAKLGLVGGQFTELRDKADTAGRQTKEARQAVNQLNDGKLGSVEGQFTELKNRADTTKRGINEGRQAVNQLNQGSTGTVRQQVQYLKDKADSAKRAVTAVANAVKDLNGRSLSSLRDKFSSNLTPAIKGSNTAATGLNNKIKDINGRALGSVTQKVRTLSSALEKADGKAGGLKGKLGEVNSLTGFGGAGDGKHRKTTKKALGGVIPGYAPGVDNVPAMLSPGEAILRPEVAHHLGADTINTWNAAAARGRLTKHAKGTAGKGSGKSGKWPMSILEELYDIINIGPGIGAFTGGIDMAGAGQAIGGNTGTNVRHWGAQAGGDGAGRLVNNRFMNMKDFVLNRVPSFLTKAPTGIGNLIGIAAGGIAPTAGQLFWDDIWKGDGNILQRGGQFMTDMVKAIPTILKDMVSNVWDSGAEILGALKDAITDPLGFFDDALSSVKAMFQGMVDQVKEMVRLLQEIWSNPSEYAEEVFDNFIVRVKDLMPNTKGLFAFADGGIVPGYSPGNDRVRAVLSPGEAVLRPEAVRRLGHSTIKQLNAGAKAGTLGSTKRQDPAQNQDQAAVPLPDAKAYEEAVAKIVAALAALTAAEQGHQVAGAAAWAASTAAVRNHETAAMTSWSAMTAAVQAHQRTATASWSALSTSVRQYRALNDKQWAAISTVVRTSVDAQIKPAQQRWIAHLEGPLSQSERTFQATSKTVWTNVQSQVSSSVTNVDGSLARLRTNVDTTKRLFETASGRIKEVWQSAMSYVDSSTRSTVNGPYNKGAVSMMSSMAKLAGTKAPLDTVNFATGGVVPGYQPGVDTVPAMLSKGEGILRPEVVRALGEETILRWNDQARKGGNVYANGGVVGQKGWSGQSGGDWVTKHKDDDYEGYTAAFKAGWKSVIKPVLDTVSSSFGVSGDLNTKGFEKGQPWAEKWTKWVDDHTSGGGQVVKVALDEFRNEAPMVGGAKYNLGNGESWCADFVSYVVDKAGANSSYGNSPKGAPGNRWPAVATWNAAMRHVPVAQSQPGDLLTYRGNGHINIKTGADDTVGGNESNSLKRARGYWRNATAALRPTGGEASADGPVLKAWPGSIPKFSGTLGGGVDSDIAQSIAKAMNLTGVSGSKWADGIATIIRRESGGNAKAVNNWDSNAKAGNGSRGLMQVVPSTFKAYHQSGTSWDIFDPVANIAAAINYIKSRYKDISNVQQADPSKPAKGYWTGTNYASPGLALVGEKGPELINFRGGERVYNNGETRDLLGNRYEIHIHEAKSEDTTQATIRALKYVETMYGM